MRFAFIAAEKARHSVTRLCRCLHVTPSGFYAWTRRGLSARAQRDVVLRTKLRAFHAASGHRYGRPNLWKDLQEDGEAVSEKGAVAMPLQPGTRLGPYAITAQIGQGGMGEVYKAQDTRLDRTVAVTVLPEHVASDPDLKQRFEREAIVPQLALGTN